MAKRAALLLAVILFLPILLLPPTASASYVPIAKIGLGYSAVSVVPVSEGVPVYTRGDQLWAVSYYNFTVIASLIGPNAAVVTVPRYLYTNSTGVLYTFGEDDPLGLWKVQLLGLDTEPIYFQLVSGQRLNASVTNMSLTGNTADYQLSVDEAGAYSIQACLLGEPSSTVSVTLPAQVSPTTLVIQKQGTSLAITRNGTVVNPFSYSFQLFQSYTFVLPGSNGTDTVQEEIGYSDPVVVTSPSTSVQTVPLIWLAPPREGRFDLRIIIDYSGGGEEVDVPVLLAGDGMVPLNQCSALATLPSATFGMSVNLDHPPSTWPRQLLLMYQWEGVESYGFYPIPFELARVDVMAGEAMLPSSAKITINQVAPPAMTSILGSELFFAGPASVFPATARLSLSLLGRSSTLNASFVPFTSETLIAQVGELEVDATSGGGVLANGTVTVTGPGGGITVLLHSGKAVFSLLPGTYGFSASQGSRVASGSATVSEGITTRVIVDLTPPSSDLSLVLLLVAALSGLAANVIVWFLLPRRIL